MSTARRHFHRRTVIGTGRPSPAARFDLNVRIATLSPQVSFGGAPARSEPSSLSVEHLTDFAAQRFGGEGVAEGRSNKEAASTLGISVKTIEAHRANIMGEADA